MIARFGQCQLHITAILRAMDARQESFFDEHVHCLTDGRTTDILCCCKFTDRSYSPAHMSQHVELLYGDIKICRCPGADIRADGVPKWRDCLPESVNSLILQAFRGCHDLPF